jgi:anaerobic magnesium-protoporphyrin IX monomethyl ester cyclase
MQWYARMGRRVWPYEIRNFLLDRRNKDGPTVAQFWGASQAHEEQAMTASRPERVVGMREAD